MSMLTIKTGTAVQSKKDISTYNVDNYELEVAALVGTKGSVETIGLMFNEDGSLYTWMACIRFETGKSIVYSSMSNLVDAVEIINT